ncbi:hypothetical protein VB715_21385 [Crocosphaera sp. UHCC 0190]|uniref:hypothetical protein n=1 Tax=Crocosphaera sp. UHCC 0190 TaxID=3110246 RepID=UPI002B201629|nr:hypothetical protein [Crocosphaera sp. UHCC 0190]MEA5512330.1 hypothetical protein [Crocosphaera sp. UHCC 0190]
MTSVAKNVSNNVIDNYIQRVTEWSHSSQRIPTTEELETIAAELGIEPTEIQSAQKQSNDHYIRAQGYMRLKHWDDAIAELQEAVAFNPSNLDMLLSLASAHMGRWQENHHREDANNIRLRIRQCLAIKPDCDEALNLLARLSNSQKWRGRIVTAILLGLGGVFVGMGSVFLLGDGFPELFQKQSKFEQLEQQFTQEINTLRREKEALEAELMASQRENEQKNEREFSSLENQLSQLQREVTKLQKKIVLLEKEKSSKITPRSSIISPIEPSRPVN